MRINVRKGLDLAVGDLPATSDAEEKSALTAALLGREFPGVKFEVIARPGRRVRAGEVIARDRRRPEVVFTAPASGIVSAVNLGRRRALRSIEITIDERESLEFSAPRDFDKFGLRQFLLTSGAWAALKKRPFGHVPDPTLEPAALLVTAIDTEPLAPEPVSTISTHSDQFETGMAALGVICEGPVFLCQRPGADIPLSQPDRVQRAEFGGAHPAGLPGTHIHYLCPIGFKGGEVWHVGYQDVISIGYLLQTGRPWLRRTITLAGPAVARPRTLSVPLSASTDEIVQDELKPCAVRVISGSVLSGHTAQGALAFLGQRHRQITAVPEVDGALWDANRGGAWDTGMGGKRGPLIPLPQLERLSPPGVLAVPLMRALLVNDIDRARDLGALELEEEDLALLSYACSSKTDYGRLLRGMLTQLHKEMS